jgi:hypothetical protein
VGVVVVGLTECSKRVVVPLLDKINEEYLLNYGGNMNCPVEGLC